jgi:GAF domain-containing protein
MDSAPSDRRASTVQEAVEAVPPTPVPSHPAIDAVLSSAATLLGMEVVFVGGLTDETFTFERVHTTGDWPGVKEGMSFDRADSFCHRLLSGAPPWTADAVNEIAYSDSPAQAALSISSYVGVPVRDRDGHVVATLCGIDRGAVQVDEQTIAMLRELGEIVAAHLQPLASEGVVIRRMRQGGWAVGEQEQTGDLTSAMVLADLLAAELSPGGRPPRADSPLDEVGQLRLSVQQLEHALAARVVVEQAIGVLTERQHSSPRDAFERLRKVARSRGRKVHELSKEIVMSASNPAVPLPPELAGRR